MITEKLFSNKKYYKQNAQSERPIRSFTKALSWRILGTADTILISWLVTGKVAIAVAIGSVEILTKMILYYGHERLWNLIKWQK